MPRPIVFLSDFGLADEFVGVCHGVVASISPGTQVIDLTHGVPRQDVRRGALAFQSAVPYLPADAVYLGVVDPGVGTARRAVVVEAASGAHLVGPDNGLLSLAWRELGGAARAVEIDPSVALRRPAMTFHGRDLFAPAAARLSADVPLDRIGPALDVATLHEVSVPAASVGAGAVRCEVLAVDVFGNAQLSAVAADLEAAGLAAGGELVVEPGAGGARTVRRADAFGEVPAGESALIVDSSGRLAVVTNLGSAARGFGLHPGDVVSLRAAGVAV